MSRALAVLALAASAAAQSLRHVADEFQRVGASDLDAVLRFSAAMPMQNQAALEATLLDISNPQSPNCASGRRPRSDPPPASRFTPRSHSLPPSLAPSPFALADGNWMTQAQVEALTAPPAAVRAEVRAWVTSTGASCGDYPTSLRCTATVAQVNALLATTVSAFRQTTKGGKIVHRIHPDTPYTFPAHLDGKLEFLTNLADFPTVKRRNGRVQAIEIVDGKAAATDYAVLLETLADFYKTAGVKGSKAATTSPAEFQADSCWSKKDVAAMAKANGVPDWNVSHVVGPCTGQNPDAEAELDEQYMGAVGQGNSQWYWTDDDWLVHRNKPWSRAPADAP